MKTLKGFLQNEDLRQWFSKTHPKGDWKRINSKGEVVGPCAREPGEAKPKCMSKEKRAQLSKKERASAVRAKRKHDPNPERKGAPINVSSYGKGKLSEDMELNEKNKPTNSKLWARAKSLARSKFDVYPSAYANGWASKWYKSKGGGWRSVKEEREPMKSFKQYINEVNDKEDVITLNIPLMIRMLELAREDVKDDMELHRITERLIDIRDKGVLTMDDYNFIAGLKEELEIDDEMITELRTSTMLRYATKANKALIGGDRNKEQKRIKGIQTANYKIQQKTKKAGDARSRADDLYYASKMKEEAEQIDELKYDTLRSYTDKAKAENLPGKDSHRGVALLTPGTRDKGVHRAVDRMKKMPQHPSNQQKEEVEELDEASPAWQRAAGKDPEGGLNRKGIASYRRANPGSKLSMAVTTKPSKLKKGSKAWKRRKSFCARMSGMKRRLTSAKTARDPNSRINKSLRKWNC